ncbi:probable mannose-P-dolichol utilization defect 1 protein [Cephalotrichum gorgonifer]|uniref:Mannose-P-dolichol utilization defect 1 protein homolog n=1 Tax=Cephalotrichum gorgonifer TaxID=2041049 RepID=A0AAE8SV92_9PEZI|nr:probable mannose-P-dolichol utilization defect 1 protein [Cephalotrichum gorgonifer]
MDLIRSTLQPITHNLPGPIRDLGISLIGGSCYETLIINIDPTDQECLKLAVSKGLGLGIVAASSIVKVPQILKLASSGSADGVSFLSYLLETTAYIIGLAYNFRSGFPFSTYGETALILAQNVIISVLVLRLSGRSGLAAVFVAALAGAAGVLFSEAPLDMKTLGYLQAGAGTLGVASKVPQILAIWREGGTGQLSAFTVFNYLVGSLTRIFTTIQEVDDKLILYGFVAGFVLNAVLAAQMLYHWNSPAAKPVSATKAKKAISTKNVPESTSTGTTPRKGPSTRRRA